MSEPINLIKQILKPFVPTNMISEEISGIYGNSLLAEMGEIIKYYNIYENGADFPVSAKDYIPSELHFKTIKMLINKEARFMFAKPIDIQIKAIDKENENANENISLMQIYINEIIKHNHFNGNILKAAKDCFIGKRIAIFCNFSEEYGITITFVPSLEFVHEEDGYGNLTKIISFYCSQESQVEEERRIIKKKYWMENNFCHISEGIYDGAGNLIESIIDDEITKFPYIPAVVIINDGLTGDTLGESEVANLFDFEQMYSKVANNDIDAERLGMNPIIWARDMNPITTENLPNSPGSFWDLATDRNISDNAVGEVGVIERNLSYSDPLAATLDRIKEAMHEQIDMPSVATSDLKGIVSSGKTFKAIYWGLIVRCDEKMRAWKYELEKVIKCLIDGALFYPEIANKYVDKLFNDVDYTIDIENQYALPEDEADEKTIDMAEVNHKTLSVKSYMKKWHNMTDEEADAEIEQIAKEKQMLEESYFPTE